MKNIIKSFAALTLIIFAGCAKELTNDTIDSVGKTVVNVGFNETKTYLGELENDGTRKVYWSDDDKINVNGVASSSVVLSDDKRAAKFAFDAVLEYPYSALYPAEMYKDAQTITLPAIQAAATNTFAVDAAPMAGYQETEDEAVTMHHLAGVVRLQVKLPTDNPHTIHPLNRVEFRGNAGEQVSGDFTVDYVNSTISGASSAEADKVVVAKAGKTLSTEQNQDVFIVVPAIRYEQGFTVRLIDAGGHYMDIKSKDITIAAGEIKAMPVVNFVPTGTLVGVEIKSAADLVAFAKAYNAKEYDSLGDELYVRLANDIVFDDETNAAWESIGNTDLYFRGTFDGCNFSIKNWNSTKPLFFATYVNGSVENLTLDASCQVNLDLSNGNNAGPLVAYLRGTVYNCHNNANLTVSGTCSTTAYIGGLVGRMRETAKVENSSVAGDVTADANLSVGGTIDFGGLVGAAMEDASVIAGSDFNGNLTFAGAVSTDDYAYIGGIIGRSKANVRDCSTSADKKITVESAENKVSRIILGGIAGSTEANGLEDCRNNSPLMAKYLRAKGTGYVYLGGVTGYLSASASVKGCHNTNNVFSYCDCNNAYVGGIVGTAKANSIIDDCHNESTAEVSVKNLGSGSYGSRYLELGGVIGRCETSIVSNISNAGKVDMNRAENSNSALPYTGGCIGCLTTSLDGQNTITNSGQVTATDGCPKRGYLALGGVVGCINSEGATLSNVSNTGNVTDAVTVAHLNSFSGGVVGLIRTSATVQNVTNSGEVYFSTSTALTHVNTGMGGIVGGTLADKVCTVKNSVNNGKVSTVSMSQKNGSGMFCGGIVGILKGAGSTVQECTNNGQIKIAGKNNSYYDDTNDPSADASAWSLGGIVGFGAGVAETPIRIVNCTNTAVCNGARGYVGGVAGYVRYAEISKSKHESASNKVQGANTSVRVGGITGYLDLSKVTECSMIGTVDGTNNAYTGGISGGMNATAVIESSVVNGTVTNSGSGGKVGAIVSISVDGAKITGCTATGRIGIGSDMRDITAADFDASGLATIE